jgi:hypothetical protein
MARLEPEPLVEALRIEAGMMRELLANSVRQDAELQWSDSDICIPFRRLLLRMLESKDRWQKWISSGVLDLTFAFRARGQYGSECQIRSTRAFSVLIESERGSSFLF